MPDFEERYNELKSLLQKILYSAEITAETRSALVKHELTEIPAVDKKTLDRCTRILARIQEPMRDAEFGIEARNEFPPIAEALLAVAPVVRAAVLWRAEVSASLEGVLPVNRDLAARVDVLLQK